MKQVTPRGCYLQWFSHGWGALCFLPTSPSLYNWAFKITVIRQFHTKERCELLCKKGNLNSKSQSEIFAVWHKRLGDMVEINIMIIIRIFLNINISHDMLHICKITLNNQINVHLIEPNGNVRCDVKQNRNIQIILPPYLILSEFLSKICLSSSI